MSEIGPLLTPSESALLLIDQQAGRAFGVGSAERQVLLNPGAYRRPVWVARDRRDIGHQGLQRTADACDPLGSPGCGSDRAAKHEPLGRRSRPYSGGK